MNGFTKTKTGNRGKYPFVGMLILSISTPLFAQQLFAAPMPDASQATRFNCSSSSTTGSGGSRLAELKLSQLAPVLEPVPIPVVKRNDEPVEPPVIRTAPHRNFNLRNIFDWPKYIFNGHSTNKTLAREKHSKSGAGLDENIGKIAQGKPPLSGAVIRREGPGYLPSRLARVNDFLKSPPPAESMKAIPVIGTPYNSLPLVSP